MRKVSCILAVLLFAVGISLAQNVGNNASEITKFEAQSAKGFTYPYYLYLPKAVSETKNTKKKYTLLVIPNNSGKLTEDFSIQEEDVKRSIKNNAQMFSRL